MCGRYTLRDPHRAFSEFSVIERAPKLDPRFNIAPSQPVPVVRILDPSEGRRVDLLRWGLVSRRGGAPVIMVRAEALSRGAFTGAFQKRRCILVADGFYEWQREGKTRIAHYIYKIDESPLAMAGIWDPDPNGEPGTCAVITRPAVAPLVDLHDRMPATVARADYDRWLDPRIGDPAELARMLGTDIGLQLGVTRVGTYVNSPKNDDPHCIEPDRATGTG